MIDKEKIKEILTRGVEEIIDKKHLKEELEKGKKLRIKLGIDPTSSEIHLGNAVVLRKLKEFQNLGHQIIFLIGDFTAKIGDPSGRISTRRPLTDEEIKKNMANYQKQVAKILDLDKTEIRYNSEWYKKMSSTEFLSLFQLITLNRVLEREDFKNRLEKKLPLRVSEIFYPLLQGYDSVVLKTDLEIGGQDQLLNMLMGRELQEKFGQKPQDIMTLSLLEGLDGVKKMSKSYNNYIGINFEPNDMFGKIMSLPDNLIIKYFILATDLPLSEIHQIEKAMKEGANPRDFKAKLAKEIVKIYHGEKMAEEAEKEFNKIFREKKLPTKIPTWKLRTGNWHLVDLLIKTKLATSKSEAKRLIQQGAVKINGQIEKDWRKEIEIKKGMIIKVGPRKFVKINTI
ncbi:MAG: tyrosine--tRNA ligase [Patescibacteria group bacterium]